MDGSARLGAASEAEEAGMGRGFGVAAALPAALTAPLAAAAEQHGYTSFWVNDTPGHDGLERLAAAAAATSRILLGVGVIPVDRRPAAEILARVSELGLPSERLLLGIGSGGGLGGIGRVRTALVSLLAAHPAPIVVGALGPRMCRLAGALADGILLNWLTPAYTAPSVEWVRAAAAEAGRPTPRLMTYVRTALPEGAARLQVEADRYAAIPVYGAHFARMGVAPVSTGVAGPAGAIQAGLAAYAVLLDETIVRAITPNDTLDEIMALLTAAAPG
jgi:alkanesulfonate monooxygenase SsuD/methylene tetrahydromethanopterin reductase-like flavin-dependent oxidoreductase (luciferase family)